TVLVGDELSPADLVNVPSEQLVGVISTRGSASSHVAILARALGVPSVMGANDLPVTRVEGCNLILDGYQGLVYIEPSRAVSHEYQRLVNEETELSEDLKALANEPAETPDKVRIPLYINSGLLSDISSSMDSGAEGIGLYRTEFPFIIRDRFPGEEEQTKLYREILEAYNPLPVTLRTLDIGGDKTLDYFPIVEENPFLGWRGIRISLDHPDIFVTQLRAMLRASAGMNNLHILLPMISSVTEVNESLDLISRAREELIDEGIKDLYMPRIGAMIEVPSSVYQADLIAKRVDFLSIGTNDLVQYLLAVDRNNSNVADLYDSLHPAVLMAVQSVVRSASMANVHVSVCGEMAGDPAAAILLLGMGMDSLSMNPVALPRIKWVIRNFPFKKARQLLEDALQMESANHIRTMLNRELDNAGLGSLLRAGK
ncbi:MAG: phosphoenolpyruvate--protein phosphotransferase, partial [Gammaproteobacteria bacterium]|nr:phosphoenolpyruvate--protein phosphotransferase [Gammaproteobacteria bacterium]